MWPGRVQSSMLPRRLYDLVAPYPARCHQLCARSDPTHSLSSHMQAPGLWVGLNLALQPQTSPTHLCMGAEINGRGVEREGAVASSTAAINTCTTPLPYPQINFWTCKKPFFLRIVCTLIFSSWFWRKRWGLRWVWLNMAIGWGSN